MPKRIQRKRTKGWRMPENTIYVGRSSVYGNPFAIGAVHHYVWDGSVRPLPCVPHMDCQTAGVVIDTPETAVKLFKEYLAKTGLDLSKLRGKNLACWCPLNQACHADVLLEIANAPIPV